MLKKPKRPSHANVKKHIKRMGLGGFVHIASLYCTGRRVKMKKYYQKLEAYNKQQEALAEKQ